MPALWHLNSGSSHCWQGDQVYVCRHTDWAQRTHHAWCTSRLASLISCWISESVFPFAPCFLIHVLLSTDKKIINEISLWHASKLVQKSKVSQSAILILWNIFFLLKPTFICSNNGNNKHCKRNPTTTEPTPINMYIFFRSFQMTYIP